MQETASQIKADWANTSLGWQERNLKIVNKDSDLVALRHNVAQLMLYNAKKKQRDLGHRVRVIIVKARQKGMSTGEAADTFEDINRHKNRHACLISMDTDGTDKVFGMTKRFQRYMPSDVVLETEHSNRKEILYAEPHGSSILCQTAGKEVLGRGGTTNRVHATEVAFWRNAERQLGGLLQEVPKTLESSVVIESTAFGTVGAFHDRYMRAIDRVRMGDYSGFIPLFVSWFVDDEYSMPVPKKQMFKPEKDHEYYGDERELVAKYSLTLEQIFWRRWMITNDFDNDLSMFKQEHPSNWREAFQGSGRMVFRPADLDEMERHCKPPIANIEFYRDAGGKVKYRNVERRANCWSVWRWVEKSHSYCCFGDVAEGLLADPNNPRSDPDRSVSGVLDRNRFDVPMTYYGRPDTVEFGDQMVLASEYWNFAWASPDMNAIGQSVLDAFKRADYQFIYQREHKEDTYATQDTKELLGFKTTTKNRKPMYADLQKVVKERELRVYDARFINELRTFIYNPQGKEEAQAGEHDDCVATLAGLVQLHKRCPVGEDFSWAEERVGRDNDAVLAVAGTYDRDEDDDEDDELMYEDASAYE